MSGILISTSRIWKEFLQPTRDNPMIKMGKIYECHFIEEDIQMASKHMKGVSYGKLKLKPHLLE